MVELVLRGTRVPLSTQRCIFSGEIGTLRDRLTHLLIPFVRAYIRHAPWLMGKRAFWARIVDPYFAWHAHEFAVSTIFGSHIAGDTRDIIQQYIYYFGVWEPHLTRWIVRRLAPGDTFIDVGANIGYYSLLASTLVGDCGSVVAVEASPSTFKLLQSNLGYNRVRNVRAVNMAVYDSKTLIKVFHGSEYEVGQTTILEDEALKRGFEVECEIDAAPLSTILRREEMENARLVKVDVEGAEWSVVHGMQPLLNSSRGDLEIMMEVKPECLSQRGKRPEDLLSILLDAGFYAYRLKNDYSALSYLAPPTDERPTRIRNEIESCTDVIFSRQDSEHL
jgi:FkbM family methyltransferase